MFVRFSLLAALVGSLVAIGTAQAKNNRDLEFRNPDDGKTYGFVGCRWKRAPNIKEVARAGGRFYVIQDAVAECLPDAPLASNYVTDADYTQITNVRCEDKTREALSVGACLRQHAGRLQPREGFFTFVHPNPGSSPSENTRRRNSMTAH